MGGKNDSPNYEQAAIAQGEANEDVVRDQTYANRPQQYTPWGSTTWTPEQFRDPGSGEMVTRWNQQTNLTPELQHILNRQIAMQGGRTDMAGRLIGRAEEEFGREMDWGTLSPMGEMPVNQYTAAGPEVENPYATRQRAEDAVFQQAQSRLAPMQSSERQALDVRLRNQGLSPGDAMYQAQMGSLDRKHSDQQNQAIWSSVAEGRNESGQMFDQLMGRQRNAFEQALASNQQNYGQALQSSQYANQLRQQQMAEAMQRRGFSLNEINALLSGQQVGMPQMPNFSQAQAAQPAPIYQAAADQGSYDAAMNPWNALIGGAGSIIGGGLAGGYF